ncbi:MAG: DUF916 and DUF3324 domain-containing protein [Lactobacillaceae bacterium]|jgi:hypothetical protein|nr:DUF916 and DUF3324 domain-containing protein [Lactobacillaceae bacterium]
MKKIITLIVIVLGLINIGAVKAAGVAEDSGFTVVSTPNQYQISEESYFDLKMEPDETTTLHMAVQNLSNEASTYTISINPAQTSDNAVIDYTYQGNGKGVGAKSNVQIRDIAKLSVKKIKVPANTSRGFDIKVKMTNVKFSGIVAGAVRVTKVTPNEKTGITNKFAFAKGIVLRQNMETVTPKLEIKSIVAKTYQYQPGIVVKLINPTNINIFGLQIKAKITNDKTGKVLQTKDMTDVDRGMAPNSGFNYVFRRTDEYPPGKYHLVGTATDKNGHKWEWNQAFEIKRTVKSPIAGINITQHFAWWWIVIAILVMIIIGLLWWIILAKRRKDEDDEEEQTTPSNH